LVEKKNIPPPMDYEKFEIICVKQYVPIVRRKILIGGMGVGGLLIGAFNDSGCSLSCINAVCQTSAVSFPLTPA